MGWSDREGPEHYVTFSGNQIPMVAAYGTSMNSQIRLKEKSLT
jgi:hypothetical protein